MRKNRLILVKHSLPKIDARVSPDLWHLSAVGKARCIRLAERLARFKFTLLASSPEPKAVETAQIVSGRLGLEIQVVQDLHEHRRRNVEQLAQEEFENLVQRLFDEPGRLVFGEETADQAHARFSRAVESVAASTDGNAAIIAHGTVIALLVARANGVEPFSVWRRMGLPSYAVIGLPGYELDDVVDQAW